MEQLEVVRVVPPAEAGPGRSPLYDAWHAAYLAADRHGRETTATPWQHDELRVDARADDDSRTIELWAGRVRGGPDDGAVVASGYVELPHRDNTARAWLAVHVHHDHRRRGHGSAVLTHLVERAVAAGRTVLDGEVGWPYDLGPDGDGVPGAEFCRHHGFALALGDVQRVLDLPVDRALLDRLGEGAARHRAAGEASYEVRAFRGPVPDDLLGGWAAIVGLIATEAPMGDLALEPEDVDPALVRVRERTLVEQGRERFAAVALHRSADGEDGAGEVVAYTEVMTTRHEPGRTYQWGTLVRRDHRGHRLGTAVKVAALRLMQDEVDAEGGALRSLVTYNAEVNAPMIAVNEALGFRPVERLGEFTKRLG